MLISLTSRFLPFTKNHGDSVAVITPLLLAIVLFSHERFLQHFPLSPLLPFSLSPLALVMKFAFKIKTEPVVQESIIVTVVAFSSVSLASITIYSQSPLVCVFCAIVMAVIVYSTLHLAPR
jgi:hypothetical protein